MNILLILLSCTAPERSQETLEKSGFTNIEIGGYSWTGCSDSDTYSTKFTATNPTGMRVEGIVCCGTFKSCTVRF